MKDIIKSYLEKQCEQDSALKEKYKPEDIDKCVAYITAQAKEHLKSKSGYVEDSIVFKWARDFYIEDVLNDKEKENKKEPKGQNEQPAKQKKEIKVETKPVVVEKKQDPKNLVQLSLFEV